MGQAEGTYRAPHVLEYPYQRSVGPAVGAFLTALRDGHLVGARSPGGRVIVPPTEYDPDTAEELGEVVEVGPEGEVTAWAWVTSPRPKHPHQVPFAWVLVRPDGADTALLHTLLADGPDSVSTGLRVRPVFRPAEERVGHVHDLSHFEAVAG
jgi:uncharacterized OB-fold protein